jgi:very-short-patch-repair endonuclease
MKEGLGVVVIKVINNYIVTMPNTLFNDPDQKSFRKELRNEPTRAEYLLWQALKGSALGYKFRRQHGIGKYVVDFYCPSKRLVVEVDGDTHF